MDPIIDDIDPNVIKFSVAGPAPNNTLVFVRGTVSGLDLDPRQDDTHIVRGWKQFTTPYTINEFNHNRKDDYLANNQYSVCAYLRFVSQEHPGDFVAAVDEVYGGIDEHNGDFQINLRIAEMDERGPSLEMSFNYSAWILTYEPRADLPPRPRSLKDFARIQVRLGVNQVTDREHTRVITHGGAANDPLIIPVGPPHSTARARRKRSTGHDAPGSEPENERNKDQAD